VLCENPLKAGAFGALAMTADVDKVIAATGLGGLT
jgi:hypothetical protein